MHHTHTHTHTHLSLKRLGLPLEGQHVFHIIASSHGGADHPDNYLYAIGSTFNITVSDRFDHFNCFLAGQAQTQRAVEVSMRLGNTPCHGKPKTTYKLRGPSSDPADEACYLFGKGQALWRRLKKNGS